jgi:putative toxin-antitoxin system antitoxin component (TIGR02293 family)
MFAEVMRDDFYRAYRIRLERLLGISREKSAQDIHELIQGGFASQTANSLMQLRLQASSDSDQISEIQMLLNERAASNGRISVLESDRLFRFGHITAMAQVIFGDDTKALRWLSKPKKGLGGRKPYELLSTTPGTQEVERMLIQVSEPFAL